MWDTLYVDQLANQVFVRVCCSAKLPWASQRHGSGAHRHHLHNYHHNCWWIFQHNTPTQPSQLFYAVRFRGTSQEVRFAHDRVQ
jgi:hypothetical protein